MPKTVKASITNGVITVEGPKGKLSQEISPAINVAIEDGKVVVTRDNDEKQTKAYHGLMRQLIHNMIIGVSEGYQKNLVIVGVGYKVEKQGKKIVLNLGHSHPIYFEEGNGITFEIPDNTTIIVKGYDKQAVGQIAAVIRSKRPPEPYLGKGVKYSGEKIRRKAGKTGK